MRPPGSICFKRLFLLSSMLWLLTGSQVWAEEEETDPRAPSWFARIENAAATAITVVTEVVEDPINEYVTGIESALVNPVQDAVSGSLANVEETIQKPIDELEAGFEAAISDPLGNAVDEGLSDLREMVSDPIDELMVGYQTFIADPGESLLSESLSDMNELAPIPVNELMTGIGQAIAVSIDLTKVELVSGAQELLVVPVNNALTEVEEVVVDSSVYAIEGVVAVCQDFLVLPVDNSLIRIQQTLGDAADSVKTAIPGEALADVTQNVGDFVGSTLPAIPIGTERAKVVAAATGNAWNELSSATRRKFIYRGWRPGLQYRTPAMAEALYKTIPIGIREIGEEAVLEFLKNHDLSHIESVRNSPEMANDLDNVIWEASSTNSARGAQDMTASQKATGKRALSVIGLKAVAPSIPKWTAVGAGVETPIAGIENLLHYYHGRKSADEAILDAALSIAVAGAASGAASYVAPYAISGLASTGITVSIGVLATPVVIGGIVVYAGYSGYRLCKAAQPEPLESPSLLPLQYLR